LAWEIGPKDLRNVIPKPKRAHVPKRDENEPPRKIGPKDLSNVIPKPKRAHVPESDEDEPPRKIGPKDLRNVIPKPKRAHVPEGDVDEPPRKIGPKDLRLSVLQPFLGLLAWVLHSLDLLDRSYVVVHLHRPPVRGLVLELIPFVDKWVFLLFAQLQ
jgi:hypothetical protein